MLGGKPTATMRRAFIVDGVSGVLKPGRITLLLGPPGALAASGATLRPVCHAAHGPPCCSLASVCQAARALPPPLVRRRGEEHLHARAERAAQA